MRYRCSAFLPAVSETIRTVYRAFAACMLLSAAAAAQNPPDISTLVGQWDGSDSTYADVWGEGEFAYVGTFTLAGGGEAQVFIIDIGSPTSPTLAATFDVPAPNEFASPQDVKVHDGLMFVGLEGGGTDGVSIVDVRDPFNPVQLATVRIPSYEHVHNLFYDNGYLYLADSSESKVGVVDLTTFDPDNPPPSPITQEKWILSGVGTSIVHDITVKDGRLYACAWNSGLRVYDVSNIASEPPVFLGSTTGSSTHSCWPTDDGQFVVTAEERTGGGIKVYRITDNGGSITLTQTASFTFSSSEANSVHNPLIIGYRVYCSWYQAGLQVFDIDPITGELTYATEYDTFSGSPSGFDGAWGVYPFLGANRILVSDMENGLHIINTPGASLAPIDLPNAVHPLLPTPVTVQVFDDDDPIDPDNVFMHAQPNASIRYTIQLQDAGDGLFTGELPPTDCGDVMNFYFYANTIDGSLIRTPDGAPVETYSAPSFTAYEEVFRDNFETDFGWTIGAPGDDASTGIWTRVDPNGTNAQPEDDNPAGEGTICWVTGQGTPGGADGENDVDNGQTTLLSEVYDLSAFANPTVGYARWYSNDTGGAAESDQMDISISNDGGATWTTLETVTENAHAWVEVRFIVGDVIEPTSAMRLRFVASDEEEGSIIEAGIDDFIIAETTCSELFGDLNGDGVFDLSDYASLPGCLTGPDGGVLEGCAIFDANQDGDVDLLDVADEFIDFTGAP